MVRRGPLGEVPSDIGTGHNRALYEQDVRQLASLIARLVRRSPGNGAPLPVNGDAAAPATAIQSTFFFNKPFTAGVDAITVLPANQHRRYLLVQNNSAGIMYLGFGSKPGATSGIKIIAGGYYETAFVAPASTIYVLGSIAGLAGIVVEG